MSDAEEERTPQADQPGDQPITPNEIGEAPPSELPDRGKNSLLKWLEEHPLIRWIAVLSVIAGAVFSIFTFFTGADTFEGVKNLFGANRCAVQPAAEDEVLVIVTDFNQGGVVTGARVYDSLLDQLAENSNENVRLVWLADVAPHTRKQAQRIGAPCGAVLVIWGVADGADVSVWYEVGIPQIARAGLESFELHVREDTPLEYAYLESFTLGQINFLARDFDAALAWFDQSIGIVEEMSEAQQRALAATGLYSYRGLLYYAQGGYEQAIAELSRAIELDPEFVAAYVNRGNSYDNVGEYERAIADYNRAIELNPENAWAYFNRGLAYSYQDNFEQAIADYNRAIELDPAFENAYFSRGGAYYYQGNLEQAIADYNRVIELDPQEAWAYDNRGMVYSELGEYERAIADFDRAIELDPALKEAYVNRGHAYTNLGEFEQAIADFDRAIELDPALREAYSNRGIAYSYQGEFEQAIADFDRAIELDPLLKEAYFNRANTYYSQGEFEQAIADYGRAIELDPEDTAAYYNRGNAYYAMGRLGLALADLQEYLELGGGQQYGDQAEVEALIADIVEGLAPD